MYSLFFLDDETSCRCSIIIIVNRILTLQNMNTMYAILLVFGSVIITSSSVEAFSQPKVDLSGPNVCTFEEKVEVFKFQKETTLVTYVTTHWCPDFSKGFKCSEKRPTNRFTYKSVPTIETQIVTRCCKGYRQTHDNLCTRMYFVYLILSRF